MRELKHVLQLDNKGCTIACMAMIVDMRYFELRQLLSDNDKTIPYAYNKLRGKDGHIGIYSSEFRDILKRLFNIESNWIQFTSTRSLKKHCVLYINKIDQHPGGGSHCMVFDAVQRKILDPSKENGWNIGQNLIARHKKLGTHKNNVHQCLEIQ